MLAAPEPYRDLGYHVFTFPVAWRGEAPEVRLMVGIHGGVLYQVSSVHLSLMDRDVYAEVRGQLVIGEKASDLPVPATASPSKGELPIPGRTVHPRRNDRERSS